MKKLPPHFKGKELVFNDRSLPLRNRPCQYHLLSLFVERGITGLQKDDILRHVDGKSMALEKTSRRLIRYKWAAAVKNMSRGRKLLQAELGSPPSGRWLKCEKRGSRNVWTLW